MSVSFQAIPAKLKQYPIVTAACLISVLCGVMIFVRGAKLDAIDIQVTESEAEWDRIEGNDRRSRDLEEHLASITELREEIDTRLLNPAEVAINYDYFYRVERESGVRITVNQGGVVDPARAKSLGIPEMKDFVAINYTIGVEGSFPELLRFIAHMTHDRFFVRVSAFNVMRLAPGSSRLTANLQCHILGKKENS